MGLCGGCRVVCVCVLDEGVCTFGGQPEKTWGSVSAQENRAQSGCGHGDRGSGTVPPAPGRRRESWVGCEVPNHIQVASPEVAEGHQSGAGRRPHRTEHGEEARR